MVLSATGPKLVPLASHLGQSWSTASPESHVPCPWLWEQLLWLRLARKALSSDKEVQLRWWENRLGGSIFFRRGI